jgi:hypothetical protein
MQNFFRNHPDISHPDISLCATAVDSYFTGFLLCILTLAFSLLADFVLYTWQIKSAHQLQLWIFPGRYLYIIYDDFLNQRFSPPPAHRRWRLRGPDAMCVDAAHTECRLFLPTPVPETGVAG